MTAVLSRDRIDAVLFDLDGVVTDTARLHASAWKRLFDEYLAARSERDGGAWTPFDAQSDYLAYVDGKPRYEGVDSFLKSRGIELPWGSPEDSGETETVCGLGNHKDGFFNRMLDEDGVDIFDSTIDLVKELRAKGVKNAIVSSSKNARRVLESADLISLFEDVVDGTDAARQQLPGKPRPDTFLEAARRLGVPPDRCAVVEDAIAGVEAGRNGSFGQVIGVDRTGIGAELEAGGADIVVEDLAALELRETSA